MVSGEGGGAARARHEPPRRRRDPLRPRSPCDVVPVLDRAVAFITMPPPTVDPGPEGEGGRFRRRRSSSPRRRSSSSGRGRVDARCLLRLDAARQHARHARPHGRVHRLLRLGLRDPDGRARRARSPRCRDLQSLLMHC